MASATRERLIKTAHELFYLEGFHTVGLDRILHEVGVTKTTFYNHFESKDDLVLEVLRWHDQWWQQTFRQLLRRHGGDSPRGQLLAVTDVMAELFAGDQYNGCIFVNVAVQFPLPHDPAHEAAACHKRAMGRPPSRDRRLRRRRRRRRAGPRAGAGHGGHLRDPPDPAVTRDHRRGAAPCRHGHQPPRGS